MQAGLFYQQQEMLWVSKQTLRNHSQGTLHAAENS